jgi:hypothetical protein
LSGCSWKFGGGEESVPLDGSTSEADAADGGALPIGVLLFIRARAIKAANIAGLARAGYTDMTIAQARIAARIEPGGSRVTRLAGGGDRVATCA